MMPIVPAEYLQKTYSQCGEDTFLTQNFFHTKTDGFYVDVGAHHPYRYSNTAIFHERGWSGLNLDLDQRAINAFKEARPNDINLLTGIGPEETSLTAYIFNEGAVNTLSAEVADDYQKRNGWKVISEIKVPVKPLAAILNENIPEGREIDILDIDVEGMDDAVLHSNDWTKFRPNALLVETHGVTPYTFQSHDTVRYLADQGYRVEGFLTLTTIFRRVR